METKTEKSKKKVSKIKIKGKALENKVRIIKENLKNQISAKDILRYALKRPKRFCNKMKNSKNKFRFLLDFFLSSRISILILIAILMAKTVLFYKNININENVIFYTNITTFLFILVLISPILFVKKNKNRFCLVIFYDIVISLLLFIDNAYWEYAVNMPSVSQILYIKYAEEIKGTLPSLLNLTYLFYIIDIPILLFLWKFARKGIKLKKTKVYINRGRRRPILAIFYMTFIIVNVIFNLNLVVDAMEDKRYLKVGQVELGSIYGYHYLDIYNTINIKETTKYKTNSEMLEAYEKLENYYKENEDDTFGIAKDKNVIILQLESIQNFLVDRTINGKEITPNLNKFLKENIEFSTMIVQSYSTTADSEYSTITSLYPLDNGQAFSTYYSSINNDIFSRYKKSGYHTSYMHGNVKEFWNRKSVYTRLPIDEISFIDDFYDTSEKVNDYLSDELFYKQAIEKLRRI